MLIALTAAALIAGLAGAWSPCGFSMVDTLAPRGYAGRMRVTVVACAAFAAGALAGGAATFGGLALIGDAFGAGGGAAVALAVAALLAAAAGDAGGRRIVPQIRRQVPESWRRFMPLPLAAALYGVLLGLGFTTFVLSFAVYALAAACVALGEPVVGLAVGVAFALGRIVPVVVLAPLQQVDRGVMLAGWMGANPVVLRTIRATGAVTLLAAALVLGIQGTATAARLTSNGTDPSSAGPALAWQLPGGGPGMILRTGAAAPEQLPGADPALSLTSVVWREGDELVVAAQDTLAEIGRVAAPGAEEPALSDRWLVWRARSREVDVLLAVELTALDAPARILRAARAPSRIGRPSLDAERVVFHLARPSANWLEEIFLPTQRRRVLRRARDGELLLNPSLSDGGLLYVSSSARRQALMIGPRRGALRRDRRIFSTHPTVRRDAGHEEGRGRHGAGYPGNDPPRLPTRAPLGVDITLWSTALGTADAYVSRTRRAAGATTSEILSFKRP